MRVMLLKRLIKHKKIKKTIRNNLVDDVTKFNWLILSEILAYFTLELFGTVLKLILTSKKFKIISYFS